MNPRRILIFSLVYYPSFIGGAEVAIKEITDRISPSEVEFDMVTLRMDPSLPKYEKIGNINVHRVGWTAKKGFSSSDPLPWYLHLNKYAFLLTGFLKAARLDRIRHYEAIWSLMATYNSFAALFFKLVHPRTRFIFTLQDGDPIPYIKRRALPLYPFFKMMFTRADHVQVISSYLADWAREMSVKCPIMVVPNAVDYGLFSGKISDTEAAALKEKLGKKEGDVFLITTSRLVAKNAIGDVIEALRYLPDNVKFLILGIGHEEASLKSQAKSLKLGDRVLFLGYVSHKEMPKYLQISEIFVRPSLSEGFGISFVEAMAAGIPVIATRAGGIPDFLKDGETGLFCEAHNPKNIAQKVEKLIKDGESRKYIVRQAREMVKDRYSWEKTARKMKEIFMIDLTV
jgi:glycosyltransferase involved in cell wall biosynthesis